MTTSTPRPAINGRLIATIGIAVAMLAIVASTLFTPPAATPSTGDGSTTQIAQGAALYTARCASCHGANLEGQPNWQQPLANGTMPAPPHDASGHTWHHNDASLFATVKYGGAATSPTGAPNAMPAFADLTDDEIWAVLAYIKSTWSAELQAAQRDGHE